MNGKNPPRLLPLLLLFLLLGRTGRAETSIATEAASGIEKYRKGEAELRFRKKDGSPAAGVRIEVTQTAHDFLFGNIVRPRYYRNQRYLDRIKELFNFVELLEFNWGQYEPDEGKPLVDERLDFIHGWCQPNGINHFYGHMLVWSTQYGEYPKTALPLWLFHYEPSRQRELLRSRIEREVRAYRGVDMLWDVINEPTHARHWGDWKKPNYVLEPMDTVIADVSELLGWAHDANPDARLLVNDYRVIVQGTYRQRCQQLIEALQRRRVPLHALGIQAHEPNKGAYWYDPRELWETCELFGSETGLPIYFTEFFYVSDPARKIRGRYRTGSWNPERQAEAIEQFYRTCFGHPAVRAIVYFGLADDDVVIPHGGLLDEHYQPKPAWQRLKRLIREEWTTRRSGTTGPDGSFRFRGFAGEYRIQVPAVARPPSFAFHLAAAKTNRMEWNLP